MVFILRPVWRNLAAWFSLPPRTGVGFLKNILLSAMAGFLAGPLAGAAAGEPGHYFFHSWRTGDGLPDNGVTAVLQTRDGYLWLATGAGLARFDGQRFTVFNTANTAGLADDRPTSLFEDAQGALWIGHERGDLTCFRQGQFEARELRAAGGRRKISAIASDQKADIWTLNEAGTLVRARDGAMREDG